MDILKAFGIVLKQARTGAGLTQEKFGAKAGYSREFISMLERGEHQPTLKTVFDLASTLKVTPEELVAKTRALL